MKLYVLKWGNTNDYMLDDLGKLLGVYQYDFQAYEAAEHHKRFGQNVKVCVYELLGEETGDEAHLERT